MFEIANLNIVISVLCMFVIVTGVYSLIYTIWLFRLWFWCE